MSTFQLILDTTPPVLTWGPVTGAVASETLTALYLLDEGSVLSADVTLYGGTVTLPMTVAADRLTVVLPDTAPEGLAHVTALVSDDVGNEATVSLLVQVSGVGSTPPPPRGPSGLPKVSDLTTWSSSATASSRTTIRATCRSESRVASRSHGRVLPRRRRSAALVLARSDWRVETHGRSHSQASAATVSRISRRPEGPDAEEEFLVWLL